MLLSLAGAVDAALPGWKRFLHRVFPSVVRVPARQARTLTNFWPFLSLVLCVFPSTVRVPSWQASTLTKFWYVLTSRDLFSLPLSLFTKCGCVYLPHVIFGLSFSICLLNLAVFTYLSWSLVSPSLLVYWMWLCLLTSCDLFSLPLSLFTECGNVFYSSHLSRLSRTFPFKTWKFQTSN